MDCIETNKLLILIVSILAAHLLVYIIKKSKVISNDDIDKSNNEKETVSDYIKRKGI